MDQGLSLDHREKQHAEVFRDPHSVQTQGSVSHSLHLFHCPSILNPHTGAQRALYAACVSQHTEGFHCHCPEKHPLSAGLKAYYLF